MQKFDKLGRRIPEFDRSAAGKKGVETRKERYGADYQSRIAANGGRHRTRGYLGRLKDSGNTEELKSLSEKARRAREANRDRGGVS